MHLTRHTDFALRLLIYLARASGERVSIAEVAERHAISRAHLMKVANQLARLGVVAAQRGRGGGIALALPPEQINLSAVIRATEPKAPMVECCDCRIAGNCTLPGILGEASRGFYDVLAKYTLADLIADNRGALKLVAA
jgi:Rrf2 family nitric oxide-sensitive transcriptional repressor